MIALNKTSIDFYPFEFDEIFKKSIGLSDQDFQANLIICKRLNAGAG